MGIYPCHPRVIHSTAMVRRICLMTMRSRKARYTCTGRYVRMEESIRLYSNIQCFHVIYETLYSLLCTVFYINYKIQGFNHYDMISRLTTSVGQ